MATSSTTTAPSTPGMSMDVVSGAINAATSIATTVAGITDMAKRRNAEIGLNYLTVQQKNELEKQLAAAQTQTERMQILSSAIVQYAIANEANAQKSKTYLYIAAAGLSVVLLATAIILIKSK
jgi:hypothetical protein